MHTGALGVVCWLLGAILWELLNDGVWGGSAADRLNSLWHAIREEYATQDTRNRLTQLKATMFDHGERKDSCLKAKAAEATSLLPVLLAICVNLNTGSSRDLHRIRCLEALCQIFSICRRNGYTMPRADSDAIMEHCNNFFSIIIGLRIMPLGRAACIIMLFLNCAVFGIFAIMHGGSTQKWHGATILKSLSV